MKGTKEEVLGFLCQWHTPSELKNRFDIQDPEAYFLKLQKEGYGVKKEKREVGVFQVMGYIWDGKRRSVQQ